MAIDPKYYIETQEKWKQGIAVDFYNGVSLCLANVGSDGNVYSQWAYPQGKDRAPKEKAVPVKVFLGENPAEAIETLRVIAAALKEKMKEPKIKQPEEDDINF